MLYSAFLCFQCYPIHESTEANGVIVKLNLWEFFFGIIVLVMFFSAMTKIFDSNNSRKELFWLMVSEAYRASQLGRGECGRGCSVMGVQEAKSTTGRKLRPRVSFNAHWSQQPALVRLSLPLKGSLASQNGTSN